MESVLTGGVFAGLRGLAPGLLLTCHGVARADETFDERHKALLARDDLQFSFEAESPLPPPPPGWLEGLLETIKWIAPALHVLFWVAVAACAAALLWFIVREVISRAPGKSPGRETRAPTAAPVYRPDEVRSRSLLEVADRLAADGRYDEAVHLLLHRSIEDIEEKLPNTVRRATTAREVTVLAGLPDNARAWLAPLARAVEFSWFGGRPLGADNWATCRQAYAEFALPETWAQTARAAR